MKALRNPYVMCILVALALVLGYYRFRAPRVVASPPAAKAARPPSVGPDASMELDQLGWTPSPTRDPFRPAVRAPATTSDHKAEPVAEVLNLKAVWLQEKGGWAVINGKVLGEGDTILGFRVEKILADGVLVQGPDGRRQVGFKPVSAPPRPSVAGVVSTASKASLKPAPGKLAPRKPLTIAQDSTAATGLPKRPEKSGP
jgi:hypothetical protein